MYKKKSILFHMFWREKNNNKNKSQLKISLSFFFWRYEYLDFSLQRTHDCTHLECPSVVCFQSRDRRLCELSSGFAERTPTQEQDLKQETRPLFFICQNMTWQPTHHKKIIIKIQNFTKPKYIMEYGRTSRNNSSDIKKNKQLFEK